MSGLTYQLGFIFRETGRALDSLGCRLQGNKAYMEECEHFLPIIGCPAHFFFANAC